MRIKEKQINNENEASPDEVDKLTDSYSYLSGNKEQLKAIIRKLKQYQLPVNALTISKVTSAVKKLDYVMQPNDKAIMHIMKNNIQPTLENVYKAAHTNNNQDVQTKSISNGQLEQMQEQINKIIEQAGLTNNEVTLSIAHNMINQDIPLTSDTLKTMLQLQNVQQDMTIEHGIDLIVQTLKEGKNINNTLLINQTLSEEKEKLSLQNIFNNINSITDNQIIKAIQQQIPLTINHISNVQTKEQSLTLNEKDNKHFITTKRQLEEIRLKLTYENANQLIKRGLKIDTAPLEKVVNELKELEQQHYKSVLREQGIVPNEDLIELLQMTHQKVEDLKYMPMTLIGNVVLTKKQATIQTMYQAGQQEIVNCQKAVAEYEQLLTQPRKDLGDGLEKAIQNIKPFLDANDIEETYMNMRAVRILAHHQMPITQENLLSVKTVDTQVNTAIQSITPTVIAYMMKKGLNPMDIQIEELNKMINEFKNELGITTEEKISEYLMQNEQSLTEEEREGMIGFYRLLHMIKKAEGKATLELVKQKRALTLNNLLQAAKMIKQKHIDKKIDEQFGVLEEVNQTSKTVQQQISQVFDKAKTTNDFEQNQLNEYVKALFEQIKVNVTPEKLYQLSKTNDIFNMPIEQLAERIENISVQEQQEEVVNYSKLKDNIDKIQNINQETLQFMKQFNMPITIHNIVTMQQFLQEPYQLHQLYNKFTQQKKEQKDNYKSSTYAINIDDLSHERVLNMIDNIVDDYTLHHLEKRTSLSDENMEQLGRLVEMIDSLSSKNHYQVPIIVEGKLTQLNIHMKEDKQLANQRQIEISFATNTYGNVDAKFTIQDSKLKGLIRSNSMEGISKLNSNEKTIKKAIEDLGYEIDNMIFQLSTSQKSLPSIEYDNITKSILA